MCIPLRIRHTNDDLRHSGRTVPRMSHSAYHSTGSTDVADLDVVLFQALGCLEYLRDVIGIEGRLVSHRYTYLPACAAPVVPHTVMEV